LIASKLAKARVKFYRQSEQRVEPVSQIGPGQVADAAHLHRLALFNKHEGISLASLVTPVVSLGNDSEKIRRSVTAIYCTMG
jgi:hypothetical protein